MAQRYFIATTLPANAQEVVNMVATLATGEPSAVRFPHVTIVPPFMLKERVTIEQIQQQLQGSSITPFTANTSSTDVFHQHERKILVLYIEPNETFAQYANMLTSILAPLIQIDTAPYSDGKIPEFRAHTSLSYDAHITMTDDNVRQLAAQSASWTVTQFGLYKEIGPGAWEAVA